MPTVDEDLIRRLPLPLAQLYRHVSNARNPLDRHQGALFLWEVLLKLLGATAIVEYAEHGAHDPAVLERLKCLARPSLGHWREFVRLLVPLVAEGDEDFSRLHAFLDGKVRDDFPRLAGLDVALRQKLGGKGEARSTVKPGELLDRIVTYRNSIAHGGLQKEQRLDQMAGALFAGAAELFGRVDVLAGRRLVYVDDIRQQTSGNWLITQFDLTGETPRKQVPLELNDLDRAKHLVKGRVYVATAEQTDDLLPVLRPLHPLVLLELDEAKVFFLNSKAKKRNAEYLCYKSGEETVQRPELGQDHRELLGTILGAPVDLAALDAFADRSQAEEPQRTDESQDGEPERLGDFELRSVLGRGGMGVVYRAWQPSLGREVAVKALQRSGDPKADARFRREIRALGRVEHPGLVKVYTSGSEGDRWYYAMELVEGADLGQVCGILGASSSATEVGIEQWRKAVSTAYDKVLAGEQPVGPKSRDPSTADSVPAEPMRARLEGQSATLRDGSYVRQIAELGRQVAEALHTLHTAGVIHRDVKPANIMLTPDGTQAVLMDLGLAQLADDQQSLTRTRQFVGTLRYASPEQERSIDKIDGRADLYSLGATLWELLTLKPLFGHSEEMGQGELIARIQREDPPLVHTLNPAVPRDLSAIVAKCLEKDAIKRYATGNEIAEDIARLLAGEPVTARPVWLIEKGWRWCRRNRPQAMTIALLLLLLVCFTTLGAAFTAVAMSVVSTFTISVFLLAYSYRQSYLARNATREAFATKNALKRSEEEATQHLIQAKQYREAAEMAQIEAKERLSAINRLHEHSFTREAANCLTRNEPYACNHMLDKVSSDNRGFAWKCLSAALHSRTIVDGTSAIATSAFVNDTASTVDLPVLLMTTTRVPPVRLDGAFSLSLYNRFFVACGSQGAVIYDSCTLDVMRRLKTIPSWYAASSPRSQFLAICQGTLQSPVGTDAIYPAHDVFPPQITVLRAQDDPDPITLRGHTNAVTCAAFSSDGSLFASGSYDGTVIVRATSDWSIIDSLSKSILPVTAITFCPTHRRVAISQTGCAVSIYDLRQKRFVSFATPSDSADTYIQSAASAKTLHFARSGNVVYISAPDSPPRIWDIASGTLRTFGTDAVASERGIALHPDCMSLLSVTTDGDVIVRDPDTLHITFRTKVSDSPLADVVIGRDGDLIALISSDKCIACVINTTFHKKILHYRHGTDSSPEVPFPGRVTGLSDRADTSVTLRGVRLAGVSTDGRWAAMILSFQNTDENLLPDAMWLCDSSTGQRVGSPIFAYKITSIVTCPIQNHVAVIERGQVKLFQIDSEFYQLREIAVRCPTIASSAAMGGQPAYIATLSATGQLTLCDIFGEMAPRRLPVPAAEWCCAAVSHRGRLVACGGRDGRILIWDDEERIICNEWSTGDTCVISIEFDKDDSCVLACVSDCAPAIWKIVDGTRSLVLEHSGATFTAARMLAGDAIVAGAEDGGVRVWSRDGSLKCVLFGHRCSITSVVVSPNQSMIVTTIGSDSSVRTWPVADILEQIEAMCDDCGALSSCADATEVARWVNAMLRLGYWSDGIEVLVKRYERELRQGGDIYCYDEFVRYWMADVSMTAE
jgi:serine/threonine protein kinase/WD40 repeat protein